MASFTEIISQIDVAKVLFFLGQFFSICSAASLIFSSLRYKKSQIMFWQMMDCVFITLADVCLGAYTAGMMNFLGVSRNALAIKKKYTKKAMILCAFFATILGLTVNNLGWVGVIALLAGLTITIGVYYAGEDDQKLRKVLFLSLLLWMIHDIIIRAYPLVIIEIISILGFIVNYFRVNKKRILAAKKEHDKRMREIKRRIETRHKKTLRKIKKMKIRKTRR